MGEYSVETKNRFLLAIDDDEADVNDILKELEAKKPEKQKTEPEPLKNTKNTKHEKKDRSKKTGLKVDNSNVTNIQNTQNKGFLKGNNNNENRPPRMRQQNDFSKVDNFEKPPSQDQPGFGSRGSRGGRGGYRGRGGRGGGRRFDRHSGSERTGVKSMEKRDGFGPHNWGGEIDAQLDNSVQEESNQAETGEKTANADGDQTTINTDDSGADAEPQPEPEPEVKEMTLDEWKAAQAGSRTKQQFNVRRAGEGEDPKQWKKAVALEPRKRAESTESYEDDDHEAHHRSEDTKATLDKLNIQIMFSDNARGSPGGGRGGRGRGRGYGGRPPRRGRGDYGGGFNNRSSRQENYAPRVDNESEFPSLGSK